MTPDANERVEQIRAKLAHVERAEYLHRHELAFLIAEHDRLTAIVKAAQVWNNAVTALYGPNKVPQHVGLRPLLIAENDLRDAIKSSR